MSICEKCKKYPACKEICPKVKSILKKAGIYSSDWIRPQVSKEKSTDDNMGRWREIPFSALNRDQNGEIAHIK